MSIKLQFPPPIETRNQKSETQNFIEAANFTTSETNEFDSITPLNVEEFALNSSTDKKLTRVKSDLTFLGQRFVSLENSLKNAKKKIFCLTIFLVANSALVLSAIIFFIIFSLIKTT